MIANNRGKKNRIIPTIINTKNTIAFSKGFSDLNLSLKFWTVVEDLAEV